MDKYTIPKPETFEKFSHNKLCKELAKAIMFKAQLAVYIDKISNKLFLFKNK